MAQKALINVDDLLQKRIQLDPEKPLVAFSGLERFEVFSARDVDGFTENVGRELVGMGVGGGGDGVTDARVVALLGLSTLEYMITMFALSRLGHTVLILSPRLSLDGYISLLSKTHCKTIVHSQALTSTVEDIGRTYKVQAFQIIPRSKFDRQVDKTIPQARSHCHATKDSIAYIMHSSGSTGLPKPIFQSHQACIENFMHGFGSRAFTSAPLFHTHGHAVLFRTLCNMGTLYFFNANLPMTSENLISSLDQIRPEVAYCVPYTLKLLSESEKGIEILKTVKILSSAGSACPDDIGNKLVANGVNLICLYGTTEVGQLMNSNRPEGDTAWDYVRPMPSVKPYIRMEPYGSSTYHMIVLDGLKTKVISNSNDPPNSFHSRDLFSPHPVIPDAWKYIGRLDDRLTLVNGEKVLPLRMEGQVRQHPAVREAVVFGSGKEVPGLLVFRSLNAKDLSDEDFIDTIWPMVQQANSLSEAFSQISRHAIVPISADIDYPRTDKGTIIRAKVYQEFADIIEDMYKKLYGKNEGHLKLTEPELQTFLLALFKEQLEINLDDVNVDFFSLGLDSLKVVHLVAGIRSALYLGGRPEMVNSNTIYANQTIVRLAAYLHALQKGANTADINTLELAMISELITKYSDFTPSQIPHTSIPNSHHSQNIILTGVTGSLGAHLLAALLPLQHIHHVYCPIRGTPADLTKRLLLSLKSRRLEVSSSLLEKVTCVRDDEALGFDESILAEIKSKPMTIVHAAWPVDFNLRLASFEPSIRGLKKLLDFALGAGARFVFCSSISAGLNTPPTEPVPEAPIPNPTFTQGSGYSRSKYIAEHICNNAAQAQPGADIRVLRLGQIVGDTKYGIWNTSEAIPLIVRSAIVLGTLPALDENCSWLPVDYCARIILELSGLARKEETEESAKRIEGAFFYNILSNRLFHWTNHFLPSLSSHGLSFKTVPPLTWLQQLKESSSTNEVKSNPSIKLMAFWEKKFEAEIGTGSGKQLEFSMEKARRDSRVLLDMGDPFTDGMLFGLFLQRWIEEWEKQ